MGKYIGAGVLVSGVMIIYALSKSSINIYWLTAGIVILIVALCLFIRELMRL
ncbi:MAG: hypothetical protein GWO08_08025 [Gammaproteobacteria bacterium]|nr:hypothetical protein [Gammaproteobacteria bacterium]NIO61649.1 hypothetical protein [Gammaproteobacteria bacterium]NIP49152.1 hypothetical protein [Gammaproteobacteria bacterium]NIQ09932.1 hypothetical protein [Gammaproteobacteria bacterium]NIQ18900.1 hypothetical protein [Gammaproteobacteria bacterium]